MKINNILSAAMVPTVIIVLLSGCGKKESRFQGTGPDFIVKKTSEAPAIDGIIKDSCWKKADSANLKLCVNGKKPEFPTIVKASWDDKYIYAAFECEDMDAAGVATMRDGPVTSEEYVAICIDTGTNGKTFAEIDVSPNGVISDSLIIVGKNGETEKVLKDWNCDGVKVSVTVHGEGAKPGNIDKFWVVEIAIPVAEFITADNLPPKIGDRWRINFGRADLTNKREISALVPSGRESYHNAASFGWLVFK
jgi:hypothetical protein